MLLYHGIVLQSVPDGNWYCVVCKETVEMEEAKRKQKHEDEEKKKKLEESMQTEDE